MNGKSVMTAKREGSGYHVHPVNIGDCHVAQSSYLKQWETLHAALGHIPMRAYTKMTGLVGGIPRLNISEGEVDTVCDGCCYGKMRADNFPRHPTNKVKTRGLLELVHSDIVGPMNVKTPGGSAYILVLVDDFSRMLWVYFLKKKSEALDKFIEFKAEAENLSGKRVQELRTDNGGEYTSKVFAKYLKDHGIRHQKTVAYTPQQNGLVERANRTIVEMTRCLLYHRSMHLRWWAEAVNTAVFIINRTPNSVNNVTAYEIWYGKRPNLKNVKIFGSTGFAHIPKEKRKKLDAKSFKCKFLGYPFGTKGYRVLNLTNNKVEIVRTIKMRSSEENDYFLKLLWGSAALWRHERKLD
ncbi:hypothetical protein PF005_g28154 [Phytophthora fragariae]|uniref:Integrase catalytic domain-containing protein n=1 Tax=Phytophthora fragariae TaxID=53985 RepID=A0A6A3PLU6_9STRA|nr:hypothetical protein PF003_g635 [Phytophthora fragariae]KAE8919531.1 hypothetical protein PF009_g30163 [Phytophthora fragariae]KAE8965453.1 hypothetical protein PF011_g28284 [Phytophthora fragariae]KAE9063235.1 hypothetical protein PF007_g29616 [Phytophthora fragariae]KAE9063902.1 hypothetical protein PF010_g28814 [Phytophthora fragariae]